DASPAADSAISVINGVLGDHLEATGNPLALTMSMRYAGQPLVLEAAELARAIPHAGGRIALLVHGLCMSDSGWERDGASHADRLRELGFTVLHLRYNSGRHVSLNGRALARLL